MANNIILKAAIAAVVKQNGTNAITGDLLQQSLLSMIDALGGNYQYAGIATPTTNPGTPDQNVFYLASTAGTYTNFGGIVLADGELAILKYNGLWTKDVTGAATQESVNQLGQKINEIKTSILFQNGPAPNALQGIVISDKTYTDNIVITEFFLTPRQTVSNGYVDVYSVDSDNKITKHYGRFWGGAVSGEELHFYCEMLLSAGDRILTASNYFIGYGDDGDGFGFQITGTLEVGNTITIGSHYNGGTTLRYYAYKNDRLGFLIKENAEEIAKIKESAETNTQEIENLKSFSYYITTFNESAGAENQMGYNCSPLKTFDKKLEVNKLFFTPNSNKNGASAHLYSINSNNVITKDYGVFSLGNILANTEKTVDCNVVLDANDRLFVVPNFDLKYSPQNGTGFGFNYSGTFSVGNTITGSTITNGCVSFGFAGYLIPNDINDKLNDVSSLSPLFGKVVSICGDSITEGSMASLIPAGDKYWPLSQLVNAPRKTYGYYLSKYCKCRYRNYGYGGSTLGDIEMNGRGVSSFQGFSHENGRYTQIANDSDYIVIWFGINDKINGAGMYIEAWYLETYGTKIYFTQNSSLWGTTAPDGTPWNTEAQYNAAMAVSGTIGGQSYSGMDYWERTYAGLPTDTTNKTFFGAYNVVLPYIISHFPTKKIVLIVTHATTDYLRDVTKQAAIKWGLPYLDMYDEHNIMWYSSDNAETLATTITVDGQTMTLSAYRKSIFTADGLHPNDAGYEFIYTTIRHFLERV